MGKIAFGISQKLLWFDLIDFYSIGSLQSLISNSVEPYEFYCTAMVKSMMHLHLLCNDLSFWT